MPKKYYCEYCDLFLKNSSRSTRLEHNKGKKHINNKALYYKRIVSEQNAIKFKKMFPHLQQMNMPTGINQMQIPFIPPMMFPGMPGVQGMQNMTGMQMPNIPNMQSMQNMQNMQGIQAIGIQMQNNANNMMTNQFGLNHQMQMQTNMGNNQFGQVPQQINNMNFQHQNYNLGNNNSMNHINAGGANINLANIQNLQNNNPNLIK